MNVVLIASNSSSLRQESVKSWKNWCANNNTILHIFENEVPKCNNINWKKFYSLRELEKEKINYENALILGDHLAIHPESESVFNFSSSGIGLHTYLDDPSKSQTNIEALSSKYSETKLCWDECYDTSVILATKEHGSLFERMISYDINTAEGKEEFDVEEPSDSVVFSYMLKKHSIKINELPRRFNISSPTNREFAKPFEMKNAKGIWQFNLCRNPSETISCLNEFNEVNNL